MVSALQKATLLQYDWHSTKLNSDEPILGLNTLLVNAERYNDTDTLKIDQPYMYLLDNLVRFVFAMQCQLFLLLLEKNGTP